MLIRTLAAATLAFASTLAAAQPSTVFTYQGVLEREGSSYTGSADYRFTLFGSHPASGPLGGPVLVPGVQILDGLFSVPLDFGAEAHGPGRSIRIEVRTPSWDGQGAEPPFSVFPEDTALTASPHALSTRGLTVSNDGARVGIGIDDPLAGLDVRGGLRVSGNADAIRTVDQISPDEVDLSVSGSFWQSLRAGRTGLMTQFDVSMSWALGSPTSVVQVRVREGEGLNGPVLHTTSLDIDAASPIDSVLLDPPVPVEAGMSYTLEFSHSSPHFLEAAFNTNRYADGRNRFPNLDLFFRTYVTGGVSMVVEDSAIFEGPVGLLSDVSAHGRVLGFAGFVSPGGIPNGANGYTFTGDNDTGLFGQIDGEFALFSNAQRAIWVTGGQVLSSFPFVADSGATIEEGLTVSGAATFQSLGVDGDATVGGNAHVAGLASVEGPIAALGGVLALGGPPGPFGTLGRGYAFEGEGGDGDSGMFSLDDGQVSLFTNNVERMRLDGGNIAIGAGLTPQSNVHILHQNVGGGWGIRIQSEAQSTFQTGMRVSNDGFFDITNRINGHSGFARLTSSGVWTTVSDERAKEDIHHLDGALDRAMRLDPVAYRYKGAEAEEIGFTAQNVAAEFPSLVTNGEDLMTLNYSGLSTVAIAALQELKAQKDAEIDLLEESNADLRRLIRELADRVEALESRSAP